MTATAIDRLYGESSSVAVKAPVKAVASGNITLSGLQTIGGVPLSEGDRCLVAGQTVASQNGIYSASSSAWKRAGDFNDNRDIVSGTLIIIPTIANMLFYQVSFTGTLVLGTTPLVFTLISTLAVQPVANITLYGAVSDLTGVVESTTAYQAAFASGLPVYIPPGQFNISDHALMTVPNQRVYGDGQLSVINVKNNFNLARNGVHEYTAGGNDSGPQFENWRLTFDQSQVATVGTRANLIQYPAAFFMRNAPRARWFNMRIEHAWIGMDCQGGSYGCQAENVDIGCYFLTWVINGSGDTTRLRNLRCISFNSWSVNQRAIYADGGNTGLACGRCDGLNLEDCIFFGPMVGINSFLGTGVNFPGTVAGAGFLSGFTTGLVVNTGFDTGVTFLQNAVGSWIHCANSYWSAPASPGNNIEIDLRAGHVALANCYLQYSGVPSVPWIKVNNVSGQYVWLQIANCRFEGPPPGGLAYTMIYATGTSPVDLVITGNEFVCPNTNNTGPGLIQIVGPQVVLTENGNHFSAVNGANQIGLSIDCDNFHTITGNGLNGWLIQVPQGAQVGSASQTVANPGVFTTSTQNWAVGQQVYILGTAPGGFANNTLYYVIPAGLTSTTVQLSATPGGAGIQCTSSAVCTLLPGFVSVSSASQTVANPGVFTTTVQSLVAGQQVYLTGAAAPGGFALGTTYYVIAAGLTGTTVQLSATLGGAGIQCTSSAACALVPLYASAWFQATIANNGKRGTINHNQANVRGLNGNSGSTTVPANTTVYLGPGGYQAAAPSVNTFQMPRAGNIVGFQVNDNSGPGGATTYTYTVYKNGVATAMSGQITGASLALKVNAPFFPVVVGDEVELRLDVLLAAAATNHKFSILFEPA